MDIQNNNVYKYGGRPFDIFQSIVRPMLCVGHEGELVEWLKEMGLIRTGFQCKTPTCSGRWLLWTKARTLDKNCWDCAVCLSKVSIREGSFFANIKCDLKFIIQTIMAWCKQMTTDELCKQLEANSQLKRMSVKRIYERCSETTSCYMMEHWQKWCLGGPGSVVLIDVFPEGYMALAEDHEANVVSKKKSRRRILCLADLGTLPPRTWLQIIHSEPAQCENSGDASSNMQGALSWVRRQVRPGSSLVANYKAQCCSMEAVSKLEGYASATSVEMLMGLDQPGTKRIQENLKTIWQSVTHVCQEVQEMHHNDRAATIAVHEYMWRQRFAQTPSTAFENLLHHISEQYSFKN